MSFPRHSEFALLVEWFFFLIGSCTVCLHFPCHRRVHRSLYRFSLGVLCWVELCPVQLCTIYKALYICLRVPVLSIFCVSSACAQGERRKMCRHRHFTCI
ncbi:hypothetical protein BJY52DRAFT_460049 [Lactarius psammicola]|nr:hypothetical protein BJY52DRAFT_460049 [Lactarius psammicola]